MKEKDPFRQIMVDNLEQCVTPIYNSPFDVRPDGISMTSDGSLIAVLHTMEGIYLFDLSGDVVWSSNDFGGRLPMITKDGKYLITQIRRRTKEDPFFLAKVRADGYTTWKREIGLIGLDGLSMTPDGSFIAVGYVDQDKKGYVTLFDHDGNTLWDHQINGRIETVAVSKSGYVVAGPRDQYIYLYNLSGELIFTYHANSHYSVQDTAIAPDETYFLFGSDHTYINCYTLSGELLWQKEVGPICTIKISQDSEYIAGGTGNGGLFLFDRNGNQSWNKKASFTFVDKITISGNGEYIAANTEEGPLSFVSAFEVLNNQGELLWQYESEHPFKALAISDDGHYLAASNGFSFFIFDNFQAIKEYKSSECVHNDNTESQPEPAESNIFISLLKVLIVTLVALFIVYYFLKRKKSNS
jgi:outer membrane protein assembly factor BamB